MSVIEVQEMVSKKLVQHEWVKEQVLENSRRYLATVLNEYIDASQTPMHPFETIKFGIRDLGNYYEVKAYVGVTEVDGVEA